MKKIICAMPLFLFGVLLFAEIYVPFFGNNNFDISASTTFAADMNDGSTGLETSVGIGLWFEYIPYSDRNITPQRDTLSVSLKLANSAIYAWRGFDGADKAYDGSIATNDVDYISTDQAMSIWFDTFVAQLEYNQFWIRVAGIDPMITLSQASIRSVMDPLMNNRTARDHNELPLPLFNTGGIWYGGSGGIVSVINPDLVHLNRREVVIAGNVSAGMKSEIIDLTLKAGSWKTAQENTENSWIGGGDVAWRPDLTNQFYFSFLGAANYDAVSYLSRTGLGDAMTDPMADNNALKENPFALGLGYERRLNLPMRMVMKPYAGVDFIYETNSGDWDLEAGMGVQWFFRGTSARFKRNKSWGGVTLGDEELPAAFMAGMNVNKDGIINGIISFNENYRDSLLPNVGGFLQVELMNIGRKKFNAYDGKTYDDFLWAGIFQIEYQLTNKIVPYIFGRYVPADMSGNTPVFNKDYITLTSKLGCKYMPVDHFAVDLWYERTDTGKNSIWQQDKGLVSVTFAIEL